MDESIQTQFEKLIPLEQKDRHRLPFPMLKSRISTSIILSFAGRRKAVIKLSIRLSKASRSFIASQLGLPGFLLPTHDNFASFYFELRTERTNLTDEYYFQFIDSDKREILLKAVAEELWKFEGKERDKEIR